MAAPPLLTLQDIHLALGPVPLLAGAELTVGPGERLALIGRNGSGKSTLLKVAAGDLPPDRGRRFLQPGTTVRYLPQEPDLTGFPTTEAVVLAGLGPADDRHRARRLLQDLGLSGDEDPRTLSGGEARRAALAACLAPDPDILLLDEPTNHLDIQAIAWLEAALAESRAALVLISHDRRFLETLTRAMVWLDRGRARRLERGFASFEAWRDEVLEAEETEAHKLSRQIAREDDWLRYGVTARRKRNVRRLAQLHELRARRTARVGPQGTASLAAAEADRSGTLVIAAERIAKGWAADGPPVIRAFSTRILRGDRVGIVGPNGAGKTTLLRLLAGEVPPDAGRVTLGTNLALERLDQRRAALDPARSLADTLTDGRGDQVFVNGQPRHVQSYMRDFLFAPEQARTPVGKLSGGERGRLLLAVALARPSNLLVLDEPTNDLDLETLDLLQEMLADYAGTVLLVSHDRDFLDRVATSVIAAEGNGHWQEYAGGYSDMLAQRAGGAPAPKPPASAAPITRKPASDSAPRAPQRAGLSGKERHRLTQLPAELARLEADKAQAAKALEDPTLYARDPSGFARAAARLETVTAALAAAEEEWLLLEMRREAAEG